MRMKREELYYRLALKEVHGIGPIKYKKLIENFGSAKDVFKANNKKYRFAKMVVELINQLEPIRKSL